METHFQHVALTKRGYIRKLDGNLKLFEAHEQLTLTSNLSRHFRGF